MKTFSKPLLSELTVLTNNLLRIAETQFLTMPKDALYRRPRPDAWSVAECLEHLAIYGDYYLSVIRQKISEKKDLPLQPIFQSGWLGEYFVRMIRLKNGVSAKKMKTKNSYNPLKQGRVRENVVQVFIQQQKEMLELLQISHHTNLEKIRVPISIAPFLTIKLGDAFRFVIYHNERHIAQAEKAKAATFVGSLVV
ncbi:MAG: DinB family protein [Flammeovirgaceae bacterium]